MYNIRHRYSVMIFLKLFSLREARVELLRPPLPARSYSRVYNICSCNLVFIFIAQISITYGNSYALFVHKFNNAQFYVRANGVLTFVFL